ncbi:hypothetical protein FRACYDRAFT_271837 [Fragilariopsis cylindrus CCMP1102]|uniref:Uncharacterized protein n=1 Tax=Fragilariopsis cylindrus CCMP1102 TaxID=635003 RepID=A0A1E7EQB0_9STRA|nr:hypothetical protein FRACYDRAFT_271837 [Fragilariopsis cylindrus CCMP1102]|eukprot:OEU08055.1 hypothetical protein FRACYDRAFT_271837 [Fragilariopsis cylindrus CCMP1102]
MFSNNLLDNISDMVVTAERKGNTFVVTDVSKGEKECESSTELLKKNSRTAEMIVVADRNGNTIVVKDIVVPSTNNENEGRRCNNRKYNNNNEEDNIDDDGSNSTVTTLSTIISAVKSLSLSTSSTIQLQSEQSPKQRRRRRNRITIATLMTGRRGRKLIYLFKIKSNSDRSLSTEEKNVSTDDLDRLLHSSLSTTSSFDSYK